MTLDESVTTCRGCGAPREPGGLVCRYCEHPVVDNLEEVAIPCWNCKRWNAWERTHCEQCQSYLLVTCLGCESLVPHHLGRCLQCGTTF